jgi:protein-L-isoaspartate(D-aspartate) O-methyltransferase
MDASPVLKTMNFLAMTGNKTDEMQRRLLCEIQGNALETETYTGRRRFSDTVMAALARVPRHKFLPPELKKVAYINRPQPIGFGQTISQPYIVAVMTDLLDLKSTDKVLEIGTGSGYQAAVLASIADSVFSMESVKSLAESAAERLKELAFDNVKVRHGDGYKGWPEEAPFDAIMITAAPVSIPQALCRQLKGGGRMIVPVGPQYSTQLLKVGVKQDNGKVQFRTTLPVAFVPMVKIPDSTLN